MNIGIFTDCYYPQINGVVTSIVTLKKELEDMGHKVIIVTINHPDAELNEKDVLRLHSIPFLPLKSHRVGAVYSRKIMEQIRKLNLDIIHTQTEFSLGIFGRIVARKLNIPVIHTYHTMYEDYMHYVAFGPMLKPASELAKKGSKFYCKYVKSIIVPTNKVKEKLEEYGLTHKRIDVVPTGIDFKPFKRENFSCDEISLLKKQIGINEDDKVVLFVGRIAKEKSIDVIINAVSELSSKMNNIKMIVVGEGPERKHLENLAYELNVQDKVFFVGEKPWKEIGKYYQLGDVFVSASTTETQGLTFTEAMAAELPVIAKYDKNLEDIMKNETNGLIFKENNELPNILFSVLNDEEFSNNIIKNANDTIEPMSSKYFGERILNVYKDVIEENESVECRKTI